MPREVNSLRSVFDLSRGTIWLVVVEKIQEVDGIRSPLRKSETTAGWLVGLELTRQIDGPKNMNPSAIHASKSLASAEVQ